jgi:mono/diheme cytochrome c family protein/cytochrome c553
MLFSHRPCQLLALVLTTSMMATLVLAAPTRQQRAVEVQLRTLVKKAGNLYSAGNYEESGKVIAVVQARVDKLVTDGDKEMIALLGGVYQSLKKAHALLELEGVELPPLKAPGTAVGKPASPPTPDGKTSFVKQVAPVLLKKCGRCHVNNTRGMFSMANFDALMKGPPAGTVIFPKDADGSRLIEVIESGDMPRGGLKIEPAELVMLRKWITEGAIYDAGDRMASLASLAPGVEAADLPRLEVMKATGKETVSFANDLAPVFVKHCIGCHGLGRRPSGRLNLNTFDGLLRGGESGAPVVPGKPADSLLIKKLKGTGGGQQMPAGADPLADDVIAMIEKWIEEGVRFDAPNPGQVMTEVAALALALRSTHEELSSERENLAMKNWNLGMPGIEVVSEQTENFLLLGNFAENTLAEYGSVAEQVAGKVASMLKAPANKPLVKGRMTLYFFDQRYDYSEFGKMVEKRDLPRIWRGHWRYSIVDAYGAVIPPRAEEYQLGPLVGQQLAAVTLAGLQGVPGWFTEGVARVVASRLGSEDPRVKKWDEELGRVRASMTKADDFLAGKLPVEDSMIASYSFARFLMADSKRFGSLLVQLRQGVEFAVAFSEVYGGSPAQVAELWARKTR